MRIINSLFFGIPIILLAIAAIAGCQKKREDPGCHDTKGGLNASATGGDFELSAANGRFASRSLRGSPALVYFGFTSCPDVCPATLSNAAAALRSLPEAQARRVQILFITVDPDRDTPEKMKSYAAFFHEQIRPLWGSPEELARVASLFGASYRKQTIDSAMGYTMDHSPELFVIDGAGHLAGAIAHGTPSEKIAEKLKQYL